MRSCPKEKSELLLVVGGGEHREDQVGPEAEAMQRALGHETQGAGMARVVHGVQRAGDDLHIVAEGDAELAGPVDPNLRRARTALGEQHGLQGRELGHVMQAFPDEFVELVHRQSALRGVQPRRESADGQAQCSGFAHDRFAILHAFLLRVVGRCPGLPFSGSAFSEAQRIESG